MAYVNTLTFNFLFNIANVMHAEIVKSERKDKRYKAIFISKDGDILSTKHFGSPSGRTYIDHGDKSIRYAYLARHSKTPGEDWNKLFTAGALSRYILWGTHKKIADNIDSYNRKLDKYYGHI